MSESANEAAVREVVEAWVAAVRRRDIEGALRNHTSDFVMFDVPPPFQATGLEAYRKTWEMFFSWSDDIPFGFTEMSITAGEDVAFVVASMHCAEPDADGKPKPLDFRLTMGLRRIEGRWLIAHEHHSVPAES